jgi:ribosomal protein S18 acetylase RimI-like enzyme
MTRPEKIEVRVAAAVDAATFGRLLHKFNLEFDEETPDPDVIAERAAPLIDSGEMAVLFVGEAPDGFAQLRFRSSLYSAARDACLDELYVVPERRGSGLGRALLEAAMEHARARGADHIELNTSEADTTALNLYESSGFTNREGSPSGPRMLYYERDL